VVLRAVARSSAERERLAQLSEAHRDQIDEIARATREVIDTARRERSEAHEALGELWEALFGDEVPADWYAVLVQRRAEAERIREERDALRVSLANCRGYLGSLAEDWEEMPDDWAAEEDAA
jgi:flagellar motility protein MotE (MotC chaperone)